MNSSDVHGMWADRSGEFSPAYYAHHGPNETSEAVASLLSDALDSDARILELGCSSGRHLAHLKEQGFSDLSGIEINAEALEVMTETYPDLRSEGTFYVDAIEDVVPEFATNRFDAVYAVETLQHIHPDNDDVFAELPRIASDRILVAESDEPRMEDTAWSEPPEDVDETAEDVNFVRGEVPLYYRDWSALFTGLGCTELESAAGQRNAVRAFRPE